MNCYAPFHRDRTETINQSRQSMMWPCHRQIEWAM